MPVQLGSVPECSVLSCKPQLSPHEQGLRFHLQHHSFNTVQYPPYLLFTVFSIHSIQYSVFTVFSIHIVQTYTTSWAACYNLQATCLFTGLEESSLVNKQVAYKYNHLKQDHHRVMVDPMLLIV